MKKLLAVALALCLLAPCAVAEDYSSYTIITRVLIRLSR
jgi:hypothetical protein